MGLINQIKYLGISMFFLWITISIPEIPSIFLTDLSQLNENQLILLRYSLLTGFIASMFAMAVDYGDRNG